MIKCRERDLRGFFRCNEDEKTQAYFVYVKFLRQYCGGKRPKSTDAVFDQRLLIQRRGSVLPAEPEKKRGRTEETDMRNFTPFAEYSIQGRSDEMKFYSKIALMAMMAALAAASVWGAVGTIRRAEDLIPTEIYAQYHAKGARAEYLLREQDGYIAVYRSGERNALQRTQIETAILRKADRAMLSRGIPAENMGEVLSLLEDLGS